jgi:uncharacterized protein YneF (UPF0154 family)
MGTALLGGIMLGKIIVRGDIVYLMDDPVIQASSIKRHLEALGQTLRTTGVRNLLVQGASQADDIPDDIVVTLVAMLTASIPHDTRIAFAHADIPSVVALSKRVCACLDELGRSALATSTQAEATTWLRVVRV